MLPGKDQATSVQVKHRFSDRRPRRCANVPHVFQAFTGVLDEAVEALDRAAFFLTQHIRALAEPGAVTG